MMGEQNKKVAPRHGKHRRKEISAARLPQSILVKIFANLSIKDLFSVMRVCTSWKQICEINVSYLLI
jgi:hypothetical protein